MAGVQIRHLIDAHYQSLYRYAYRLSGSSADAEDLTQTTYSKAMARLGQLREPERARSWLYRILRNEYLHRIRDERKQLVVPMDNLGELPEREAEVPPEIDSATLQAALNGLEEAFRTPLILFYFEEMSYRDIAEQLDVPIGTVMSRLARGKAYLKTELSPHRNGHLPEDH